jgi:hypothetical protein
MPNAHSQERIGRMPPIGVMRAVDQPDPPVWGYEEDALAMANVENF